MLTNSVSAGVFPKRVTVNVSVPAFSFTVVEPGEIDPETVVTPGIFVSRIVRVHNPVHESELIATGVTYP